MLADHRALCDKLMPYLLLLLVVLFFSGNFIVARGIQDYIPPVTLSFWRWALALLLLFPFSARSFLRQKKLILCHWKLIVILGILGVSNFSTFVYIAMHATTVTNTVLVNAINPVFIVICSWIGFKDRISLIQFVGIAISFAGLVWIISGGDPGSLMTLQFAHSDLWTIAAAFSWALYTVLLRQYPVGLEITSFLTALFIAGLIFLLPFYALEFVKTGPVTLNAASISGTMYLGIFPSIFAYIFWNKGVQSIGANKAGVFIYLIPVVSIALAYFFFDERFKSYHPPGIILIALGIFLATYFGKETPPVSKQGH